MTWSIAQGVISRAASDWLNTRYRGYQKGDVSELTICGEMVQVYAGLREEELRQAAARYISEFLPSRLFAEMAELVERLRSQGAEIWAVSSTNKWVVAEGVRALGIPEDRILAAEIRSVNGVLTEELIDVPTDEQKAAALRRVGLSNPDAVFGNSVHDLAMLEIAHHPYPVNPSPALLQTAQERGWRCFMPHSVDEQSSVGGE